MAKDTLSLKQAIWLEAYLETWNATEAARRAGYKSPSLAGHRLLKKCREAGYLREAVDRWGMGSDETLLRLAEQARVNIAKFIQETMRPVFDEDGNKVGEIQTFELNWETIKNRGHLVKKISNTRYGVALELHDGQTALIQLGKANGALTDRLDITSKGEQVNVVLYLPENGRGDSR